MTFKDHQLNFSAELTEQHLCTINEQEKEKLPNILLKLLVQFFSANCILANKNDFIAKQKKNNTTKHKNFFGGVNQKFFSFHSIY